MATVQKRSALSKTYLKPAGTQDQDEQKNIRTTPHWRRNNLTTNGPAVQREEHENTKTEYFYSLGHDEDNGTNRSYYCFVGLWGSAVVVHIRLYNDDNMYEGRLIPTKEGCCLNVDEYEQLAKYAPVALSSWKEQISKNKRSTTLRYQLGEGSNWYLLVAEDFAGKIKFAIKSLTITNKVSDLLDPCRGALLNDKQFQCFVEQAEEISKIIKNIEPYVMSFK